MLEDAHHFIEAAAEQLGLPKDVQTKLKQPDAEHVFQIKLEGGQSFDAYRVQHSNQRGPYKGGIRFHPQVSLDEIRTLATLMSLKTAAVDLPLGGGKGGVTVDPRKLNQAELEELSRKYVAGLHTHIGPDKDVPASDVNTNATIIDWMLDEYQKLSGDSSPASFTGKSIDKGGSAGRDAATGRGGVLALAELLQHESDQPATLNYAVQGFGNVGSYFAAVAEELQPKWQLVAASDSETAVYSSAGLPASQLQDYKAQGGRFKDYQHEGVKLLSNDELLALDVDVLVLAGLEDAVDDTNVQTIRAKYLVEMANGPITFKAYEYLAAHDHIILPDIIANAGGVIVSYLEWLQNRQNEHWTKTKVNQQLSEYMEKATKEMYDYAQAHQLGPRLKEAAFAIALQRLTRSTR